MTEKSKKSAMNVRQKWLGFGGFVCNKTVYTVVFITNRSLRGIKNSNAISYIIKLRGSLKKGIIYFEKHLTVHRNSRLIFDVC